MDVVLAPKKHWHCVFAIDDATVTLAWEDDFDRDFSIYRATTEAMASAGLERLPTIVSWKQITREQYSDIQKIIVENYRRSVKTI